MSELRNPADNTGWIGQLWDALRGLRDEVRDLRQVQRTYHQEAEVTSYVAGDYVPVTFDSGEQALARKFVGYTPVDGHIVLVAVSQGSCYIVGRIS